MSLKCEPASEPLHIPPRSGVDDANPYGMAQAFVLAMSNEDKNRTRVLGSGIVDVKPLGHETQTTAVTKRRFSRCVHRNEPAPSQGGAGHF